MTFPRHTLALVAAAALILTGCGNTRDADGPGMRPADGSAVGSQPSTPANTPTSPATPAGTSDPDKDPYTYTLVNVPGTSVNFPAPTEWRVSTDPDDLHITAADLYDEQLDAIASMGITPDQYAAMINELTAVVASPTGSWRGSPTENVTGGATPAETNAPNLSPDQFAVALQQVLTAGGTAQNIQTGAGHLDGADLAVWATYQTVTERDGTVCNAHFLIDDGGDAYAEVLYSTPDCEQRDMFAAAFADQTTIG